MPTFTALVVSCRGRLARRAATLVVSATMVAAGLTALAAPAAAAPVTTFADLQAAFAAGGTVVLGVDLTADPGQLLAVGTTPVTLDLNGHNLTIPPPGGYNPAVEVSAGRELSIEDLSGGGVLTATGAEFGAGIGGASSSSSGSVTVNGGTVIATGGFNGAGIGGGTGAGNGSVTVNGGTVHATGGSSGAGIGGGNHGGAGTVTVNGGTVDAHGGSEGAGIGGGVAAGGGSVTVAGGTVTATAGLWAAGIGGGYIASGGTVAISAGAWVTARDGGSSNGFLDSDAIGFGAGGAPWGSLSNSGLLTLPAGSHERVPSGATVENAAAIELAGTLTGAGAVHNTGAILVDAGGVIGGTLYVAPNNYTLSFVDGGTALPADTLHIYASTVSQSGQALPDAPSHPNGPAFLGWFTAPTGGTQVDNNTVLNELLGDGPTAATLYAHYATTPVTVTAPSPTITYGDPIPALTPTYSDGVTPATGATCTTTASANSGVGTYPVTCAGATDPNYTFSYVAGTLTITQAPLTITASSASFVYGGTPPTITASYSGFVNGEDETVLSSLPICSTTATSTSDAGTYPSSCTGAAAENYAISYVDGTITVLKATPDLQISAPATGGVVGETAPITATSSAPELAISFSSGTPAVCSVSGTTVTYLHPGSCEIDADQAGDVNHNETSATSTVPVSKAATMLSLTVRPHRLVAAVAVTPPGAGTPTGTVTFQVDGADVGTADFVGPTATLNYRVRPGQTRQVSAVYSGDADFTGSSASTARHDPSITARVTSAHRKTRYGWYRSSITVHFTCTADGAPLTRPCPAAVTVTRNGAGMSVTRTIHTTDGGAATVTVSGLNLDSRKPHVAVRGITNGAVYPGRPPRARCVAGDALSGVASCHIRQHTVGNRTSYTATAVDRAGNVATAHGSYRTPAIYLVGVRYTHHAWQVRLGHSYTLVVTNSAVRPRYIDAAPYPRMPAGPDHLFSPIGHHRWALTVTITRNLGHNRTWNLGVRVGHTLHAVRVHTQ